MSTFGESGRSRAIYSDTVCTVRSGLFQISLLRRRLPFAPPTFLKQIFYGSEGGTFLNPLTLPLRQSIRQGDICAAQHLHPYVARHPPGGQKGVILWPT